MILNGESEIVLGIMLWNFCPYPYQNLGLTSGGREVIFILAFDYFTENQTRMLSLGLYFKKFWDLACLSLF